MGARNLLIHRKRPDPLELVVGVDFGVGCLHCNDMKGSLLRGEDLAGRVPELRRRGERGLTLIELLVVVAVIAVLAGITLAAMGGVNQKAARDRTKAEIAAIVNALERYKSQNDSYPAAADSNLPYAEISAFLPISASSLTTNDSSVALSDPFGTPYLYRNPGSNNIATFDVWSTAGAKSDEVHKHIGNW
jgi:general secretion pathway protein G